MNIAIFGGSFDPPHAGHDEIVKAALNTLDIDKLIIIPTFCSPFKSEFSALPKQRLSWCKALWGENLENSNLNFLKNSENSKILVSDFEILRGLKNGQKTPTITSVRHFKELLKPEKIYLIIGADCLENLHKWAEFSSLCELVEFVVATRENSQIPDCFKTLKNLEINVNISSSIIRKNLDFKQVLPKILDEVKEFYGRKNQ